VKFVATKKGLTTDFFHSSLLLLFLDPGSEIRDPEWVKKSGSGIRDKHPGSTTLNKIVYYFIRDSYYLDMVLRCGLHGPRKVGVDTPPIRVQVAATREVLEIEYENLLCQNNQLTSTLTPTTVLIRPEQLVCTFIFFKLFYLFLFEGTFTSFFKDRKSYRSHKTVEIKVFLYFAC
jgi:hypothetical protein